MLAYTHTHPSHILIDQGSYRHCLSLTHFHTFNTHRHYNEWKAIAPRFQHRKKKLTHIRNPPLLGHGLWQQQKMRTIKLQRVSNSMEENKWHSEEQQYVHIPSKNSCLTNWTTMHVLPTAKEPKVPSSIVSLFVDMMVIAILLMVGVDCNLLLACLLIVDWLLDWLMDCCCCSCVVFSFSLLKLTASDNDISGWGIKKWAE